MRGSTRRTILRASATLFSGAIGWSTVGGARRQNQTDDNGEHEPDFVFEGRGQTVTQEVTLEKRPTVGKLEYGGDGSVTVNAIPQGKQGYEEILVMTDTASPGVGGMIAVDGPYVFEIVPTSFDLNVESSSMEWRLTITQPAVTESEIRDPPLAFEGAESTVLGPFRFDGTETATATHDGEGTLEIEILPQNADFTTSLFYEFGSFNGETVVRTDGVGWVTVQATGDWTLTVR